MTLVYVVTHNGQVEQVFSTQGDATQYVSNASAGNGAEYAIQPFKVSTLGGNGEVLDA
jgi:hypothetical protein